MKSIYLLFGSLLAAILLQGCLATTSHSFNNGKMLSPGNARGSLGFGRVITKAYREITYAPENIFMGEEPWDTSYTFIKEKSSTSSYKKVNVLLHSFSFDFQLGISKKFPFGKGTNIGFHRELPGYSARKELYLMPTTELIVKCGLHDQARERFTYNHNVLFGWQRGFYVDNGFFMEYAGGFELPNRKIPYFNVRVGFTPTDPTDRTDDPFEKLGDAIWDEDNSSDFFTYKKKRLFGRVTLGNTFQFKRRRPIVPEIFTEASFNIIHKRRIYPTVQLGLSWKSFFNAK